jgi:NAD(P) transhydrogenase subunit alpha
MSAGNAICGIILVGAILVAAHAEGTLEVALAITAVGLATVNVVGGFLVTDRMLKMFRPKEPAGGRGPGERA